MKFRKLAAAGAAATLMFTLGACGDEATNSGNGGNTSSQFDATQLTSANFGEAVKDSTSQAQSVHLSGEFTIGDLATITIDGDVAGTQDPADAKADLTMTMSGAQLEQAGMSDMEIQMIMVDKMAYMKLPEELMAMTGGSSSKPWMKMDMDELSSTGGSMTGTDAGSMDPNQMIEALSQVGEVKNEGASDVNGVEATKYAVTIDTKKLMEQSGDTSTDMSSMPATIPVNIYLDSDSLPVRLELGDMDIQGQTLSGQLDFTDWGKDVSVEAPPADEVTEMPSGLSSGATAE